jgi:hypothetical protein
MRSRLVCLFIFLLVAYGLWAVDETEPNDTFNASGVCLSENGTHNGVINFPGDVDFWKVNGTFGDSLTVSTMGFTTLDTYLEIRNAAGEVLASNNDYGGTAQSYVQYLLPESEDLYIRIACPTGAVGAYSFSIRGLFASISSAPYLPYNLDPADGATGVSVYQDSLSWTWGDGSALCRYNVFFGTDPENLQMQGFMPLDVEGRECGMALQTPLIGGITYYFAIQLTLMGTVYQTPVYSFSTGVYPLPIPFTEDFNGTSMVFSSIDTSNYWIQVPIYADDPANQAIIAVISSNTSPTLLEKGTHDLSVTTGAYFSFSSIALMEPGDDHCYVEYSTNNGASWTIFPASAYRGTGVYAVPTGNYPEGPCFDAGSYDAWADYMNISDVAGMWRTETFDLSPWAGCSSFKVRFRAVYDADNTGRLWAIDDFNVLLYPPSIPTNPSPSASMQDVNTNLRLSWQANYANAYEIAFGTNPAVLSVYLVTESYWDALSLSPYTTYYWKVRSRNSVATTDWSSLWSFRTQQYATPWHQNAGLSITNVSFGTINNNSGWNGYYNYSALTSSAQCGIDLPISVSLMGGYGPEAVRVWVDVNRDAVFSNTPADGEYWDIPWGSGAFQGNIHLPSHLVASPTRMRVQAIHTDGSDVLMPSGVLAYGETEDYLLLTADNPILSVSPTWAVFADTMAGGESLPVAFVFDNSGGQSLDVTVTGITGTDSGSFTLTDANSYPLHIVANTATVNVRFTPQGEGAKSAFLMVRDNLSRTDHYYPLSGTGIGTNTDGALCFDGSGEYVNIASAAPLQSLSRVTIETWFKWDGSAGIQFIIAKNAEELEIHTNGSNASIRFIPTNGVYIDSYGGKLIAGQWQHIACVYNPSVGLGKVYIDGKDVTWQNSGPNLLTTALQSNSLALRLGLRQNGTYALAGCIDELRIWNTARTAEEIRDNMHLLQSTASVGLVANWRFNELSGTNVFDQIGNLNGTMIAMETGDRIQSTVPLGVGSAKTLSPSATGVLYDFTGTGMKLSFNRIDAVGAITVTRLVNADAMREVLNGQTWIVHTYDTAIRKADMQCTVSEDVQPGNLPAYSYSLMSRNPVIGEAWSRLGRAVSADVDNEVLSFADVNINTMQNVINWAWVEAPTPPQNVTIEFGSENVQIHWSAVSGATRYKVYSSAEPEGTYSLDTSGTFAGCSWSAPVSAAARFYKLVSEIDLD